MSSELPWLRIPEPVPVRTSAADEYQALADAACQVARVAEGLAEIETGQTSRLFYSENLHRIYAGSKHYAIEAAGPDTGYLLKLVDRGGFAKFVPAIARLVLPTEFTYPEAERVSAEVKILRNWDKLKAKDAENVLLFPRFEQSDAPVVFLPEKKVASDTVRLSGGGVGGNDLTVQVPGARIPSDRVSREQAAAVMSEIEWLWMPEDHFEPKVEIPPTISSLMWDYPHVHFEIYDTVPDSKGIGERAMEVGGRDVAPQLAWWLAAQSGDNPPVSLTGLRIVLLDGGEGTADRFVAYKTS